MHFPLSPRSSTCLIVMLLLFLLQFDDSLALAVGKHERAIFLYAVFLHLVEGLQDLGFIGHVCTHHPRACHEFGIECLCLGVPATAESVAACAAIDSLILAVES